MAEHTPTPWTFDHDWHRLPTIFGADKYKLAIIEKDRLEQAKANAAFIVKAVNNHAALVDALLSLDTLLDFGDEEMGHVWEFEDLTSIKAAFDKARAALEQVTGAPLIAPRHT